MTRSVNKYLGGVWRTGNAAGRGGMLRRSQRGRLVPRRRQMSLEVGCSTNHTRTVHSLVGSVKVARNEAL